MKTVQNLIKSINSKKLGNHKVVVDGYIRKYYYYSTCVCEVNEQSNTYKTNNGGWGTSSTTRTINSYKRELDYIGFKMLV